MAFRIPGLGGASGAILRAIEPLFRELFDKTVGFIWGPLKPWLGGVLASAQLAGAYIPQLANAVSRLSNNVGHFFDHIDDYVAAALVEGFKKWIRPVTDLLFDWVESLWDGSEE